MSTPDWERAQELFHDTLDRDESAREAFLQDACAGDAQLLTSVRRLVDADIEVSERSRFIRPLTPEIIGQALGVESGGSLDELADRSGDAFSSIVLTRLIGSGGMGAVYEAVRSIEDVEQRVAVKLIRDEFASEALRSRFREERRTLARLNHPGIARFYDVGSTPDGKPFLVMELVEGVPITTYCDERHMHVVGRVDLFIQVCKAVQYSHTNLIIHRDIKPRNVLVDGDGTPKLIDFGIAEEFDPEGSPSGEADASPRALTPGYASPEQVRGGPLTAGSDVYSLGVLLYELLAGSRPATLTGVLPSDLDASGALHALAPPSHFGQGVGPDLDAIVLKALCPSAELRYATVGELADDLERMQADFPVRARPNTRGYLARKFVDRYRWGVIATLVALVAFLVSIASVLWSLVDREQRTAEMLRLARMADLSTLDGYEGEAALLWPARPATVPALEAWLLKARALAARQDPYRQTYARLSAEVYGGTQATVDERWQRAALAEMLGRFDSFQDTTLVDVEQRLERARTIRERSIAAHADEWERSTAAIEADPAYAGLQLEPQLGLVPIGQDPESGFFEFAHVPTGSITRRAGDGVLEMTEGAGLVLVLLPGGCFTMGARLPLPTDVAGWDSTDQQAQPNEGPPNIVDLAPFFLSKYEMTQGQWTRFSGANPSRVQPGELHGGVLSDLRHPVETVSWDECAEVLARLALEIPSEAQWEYAARGGTSSAWWTGADEESLQGVANLADAAAERAGAGWRTIGGNSIFDDGHVVHAPAGQFVANPFGLYDVIGNVWEWTADELVPYTTPASGPRGRRPESGSSPIVGRGGSFMDLPDSLRSAHRGSSPRDIKDRNIGLRPARAIE
ncbi:MAG: sulfatase activating formylglycine-generating enzyme [Chlamydiales bacterium]|jgi:formylglycine-generating enzyme required for sulfatase activity/tRNA A-37 threonylcarbamoyl transferase component Bud32